MVGLILIPSASWPMEAAEGSWLPSDAIFTCFSKLAPLDRTRAGQVCQQWYGVSNNVGLWHAKTGKHSWIKDSEKFKEMHDACHTLYREFPEALQDFMPLLSTIPLSPTAQSYKDFYAAEYLDQLSRRQADRDRAYNLRILSNLCLQRSYDEGNPHAIRHYTQVFEVEGGTFGINACILDETSPLDALRHTIINDFMTAPMIDPKNISEMKIKAALYGSCKHSAAIMRLILDKLQESRWKDRKPSQEEVAALVKFGNSWPNAREVLLLYGYTPHE